MSYTNFLEVSNPTPGSSTKYGSRHILEMMQILNGKIVPGRRPKVANEWLWLDHFDFQAPTSEPSSPDSTIKRRLFVDPTDNHIKVKKSDGTKIDLELAGTVADNSITNAKLTDNSVTSAKIVDGTIANIDISQSAAIAKSKLAALAIVDADVSSISHSKIGTNLLLSEAGLTAPRTFTFPDLGDAVTTLAATQTLSNKTLLNPKILTIVAPTNITQFQPANASDIWLGQIIPTIATGTSNANRAVLDLYNGSETTNFEVLEIQCKGTGGYNITPLANGTGVLRALNLQMNRNNIITINTDNSIDYNSRTGKNQIFDVAGTGNHLTSASAAIGDILAIQSGTDFTRLARGAAYQALRVKKDGSALEYADPFNLPSSGRMWGVRAGFNQSSGLAAAGNSLLATVSVGNGTGVTNNTTITSTDGNCGQLITGTNNTKGRAGWWNNTFVMRKLNPIFTIRFRLAQTQASNQGILYIGFVNQSAQPAAGTSLLDTYLDTKIGVLFGFRSSDTTFMIISNNAQTLATYTTAGTPNSSATDTNAHTLSIQITDSPAQINWWFDGVAMTSITDTTNNVPPSTTSLNNIFILEAQTATSLTMYEHWSQLSQDWL